LYRRAPIAGRKAISVYHVWKPEIAPPIELMWRNSMGLRHQELDMVRRAQETAQVIR
jgi:hypothetical protein